MSTINSTNNESPEISPLDGAALIVELIEKYNIIENEESFLEKIKNRKILNAEIVGKIAQEAAVKKIPAESVASSLQKELGIDQQIAQPLSQDIVNKVVPLIQRSATAPASNAVPKTSLVKEPEKETISTPAMNQSPKKPVRVIPEMPKRANDPYRESPQ